MWKLKSLPQTAPVGIKLLLHQNKCLCVCVAFVCSFLSKRLLCTPASFLLCLLIERHWKEVSACSYLAAAETSCEGA